MTRTSPTSPCETPHLINIHHEKKRGGGEGGEGGEGRRRREKKEKAKGKSTRKEDRIVVVLFVDNQIDSWQKLSLPLIQNDPIHKVEALGEEEKERWKRERGGREG